MDSENKNIYHLYKPLRNYLRKFSLMDSLAVIRAYLQNLQFNQPFPKDIQVDISFLTAKSRPESGVHEWQLETLVREIILNCDFEAKPKTLKDWRNFSSALNKLKDLESEISINYRDIFKENIFIELYRISHRQFPWQYKPNLITITRYYKIFSDPKIDSIIQKNLGLTTQELYTIGLAFVGVYIQFFALHYPPDLKNLGITKEKLDLFLKYFSTDIDTLKQQIKNIQSYDQDYAYTLSPLKITPLTRVRHNDKDSFIAPVPTFLFNRFTEGVYYEICKDKEFAHAFGQSFQNYIGEVLKKANNSNQYGYFEEEQYRIGKNQKATTDWIVTDLTGNIFIECKTKRLRVDAKIFLKDNLILEEELDLMAGFIVQTYSSISDYKNNHYPNIKDNSKKCFPLIVTLEEWYTFGDKIIKEMLDVKVKEKLIEKQISLQILENEPYTICSAKDFEVFMQIINLVNIEKFMSEKTSGEHRLWALSSFMFSKYPDECAKIVDLFPEEYKEIHPSISE